MELMAGAVREMAATEAVKRGVAAKEEVAKGLEVMVVAKEGGAMGEVVLVEAMEAGAKGVVMEAVRVVARAGAVRAVVKEDLGAMVAAEALEELAVTGGAEVASQHKYCTAQCWASLQHRGMPRRHRATPTHRPRRHLS